MKKKNWRIKKFKKEMRVVNNKFKGANRAYIMLVQPNQRFKLVELEFLGKELKTISRNWKFNQDSLKKMTKKHPNLRECQNQKKIVIKILLLNGW